MTHSSNNTSSHWIDAWLETQQGWLGQWQATAVEQRVDAMRASMETLRQQFNPANPSPAMLNMVQSFQSLLQSCMAQTTAATQSMVDDSSHAQLKNNIWQQVMQAFPLGYAREQQLAWQSYLKAQGEYQLRSTLLMQAFAQVFTQSLQAVPDEVEKRAQAGQRIQSIRELYDVWIECGEGVFAVVAHDPAFIATQSATANALGHLKSAEHTLLEHWLKLHDLPTRTELNSVHQKLRSMSARIVELEAQLAQRASAKPARSKKQ